MSLRADDVAVVAGPRGRRWRLEFTFRTVVRGFLFGGILLFIVAGVFANLLAPHDYERTNLTAALRSPEWLSGSHVLGTDQLGRDMLSRLLFGVRTSLLVGIAAVAISGTIGITLGLVAGYAGGLWDLGIMRLVDLQMSIPSIVLLLFLAFLIGPGLQTTILILGVSGWLPYARMVRAEIMVVNEQPYMMAAKTIGASPIRSALLHALPQVMSSIIVLSTLQFGAAIILEAAVSFIGFGLQPPDSSLGLMVSDARSYLRVAWWIAVVPTVALFALVLLVNLTGDELQDILDPVKRRSAN